MDANQPVVDSHLDHVVDGGQAASRLVVLEQSCRDDLGPQELDALGREALLDESARPAGCSLGQVGSCWSRSRDSLGAREAVISRPSA